MPFFVLAAPAVGFAVGKIRHDLPSILLALVLLASAWPWLSSLQTRPLITKERGTYVDSILVEGRDRLYLALALGYYDRFEEIVDQLEQKSCSSVGIMLSGDAPEYPLVAYMGAPSEALEFQWIVAGVPSAQYSDPEFSPCAVVCDSSCPSDWADVRGIPLYSESGGFRLYLDP